MGARLALKYGLAVHTAGGTHHAFPDCGSGFCLLNDIGVTARQLLLERAVQRVLVLDLDVHQARNQGSGPACWLAGTAMRRNWRRASAAGLHACRLPPVLWQHARQLLHVNEPSLWPSRVSTQGDGTALIFQDEPAVFTVSVHGASNFPARKQKSSLDVPLPDATEDAAYLGSGLICALGCLVGCSCW